MTNWRDAAAVMFIPYDQTLGVHPQVEGFYGQEIWDFANTMVEQHPLLLNSPTPTFTAASGETCGSGAGHAAAPRRVQRRAKAGNFAYMPSARALACKM